jgi:phage terminase large subunit-like protein
MLILGLRLGDCPQAMVTTTAKIAHKLLKNILKDPYTITLHGHTFDNEDNLNSGFIEHIKKKYEGTRLGRQELEGQYIDEGIGVLWNTEMFQYLQKIPDTVGAITVAIDPSITDSAEGAETGIIVAGADSDKNGYVLHDATGHYGHRPVPWVQSEQYRGRDEQRW